MKTVKSYMAANISELDETEIREKEYLHQFTEFDDSGLPVEAITYYPDGSVEHKYKYVYDGNGKVIDELLLETDDEVTEHRSMEYNAEEQLEKEYIHYLDGTADQLIYTYDKEGRLISRRSIDSDGETGNYMVNLYDGDHLASETEYEISGEIITQRKIIYDENGKITEEIFKTPEEDYQILYTYDEQGVASVRRRYNADKHLTERNTFTYDTEGRLSESMEETNAGIEITYTAYDTEGNTMLQEVKTDDGDLLSSIERTYDNTKRPLTTAVLSIRPGQNVPQHYRIRIEYE